MKIEKKRSFAASGEEVKESKYRNKRVMLTAGGTILMPDQLHELKGLGMVPSGIVFDSRMEAEYYMDVLLPRELAGEIEVTRQPRFVLIKEFEKDGVKYRPITYIPDFLVKYYDERPPEAIDVKGVQTESFNLKRKLFDFSFPDVKLLVMKRVRKYGGWITVEEYAARKKQDRTESRRSLPSRTRGRNRKWI